MARSESRLLSHRAGSVVHKPHADLAAFCLPLAPLQIMVIFMAVEAGL